MTSLSLYSFTVTAGEAGRRLDQYLTTHLERLSRARVQELIAQGKVRVAGAPATRSSLRLKLGQVVEAEWTPAGPLRALPEPIPLDILYQDEDVVVINKPAGMAVHPAGRLRSGTLVNALLHHFQTLSAVGGELRPGLVHRLDRMTSGVLVVARNDVAHRRLAAQFAARQVEKTYLALVQGRVKKAEGTIDTPIGRDLVRRVRMTARRRLGAPGVRAALSHYRALQRYEDFTLLEVKISTGRTHQIRAHLASIGHPVVGDTLYGARGGVLRRHFLHAWRISFVHPSTRQPLTFTAPLPAELEQFLARLTLPPEKG